MKGSIQWRATFFFYVLCLLCLPIAAGLTSITYGEDAITSAYIHDYIQGGSSGHNNEIPAYCTSQRYTVSIDGREGLKPVHVYTSVNDIVTNLGDICLGGSHCSDQDEPQALADMMTEANHWASFDYGDGVVTLTVITTCGSLTRNNIEDIPGQAAVNRDALVHPRLAPVRDPEYVDAHTFKIKIHPPTAAHWPRQFYLKLPGLCHQRHPLFIFANPLPADGKIDSAHPGCPADDNDPLYTILGTPGRQTDIDPGGALDSIGNANDHLEKRVGT